MSEKRTCRVCGKTKKVEHFPRSGLGYAVGEGAHRRSTCSSCQAIQNKNNGRSRSVDKFFERYKPEWMK